MRYLILGFSILSACTGGEGDDAASDPEVLYAGAIDEDSLSDLIVSDVSEGAWLEVRFSDCADGWCAEATVVGTIETIAGDVFGTSVIEDVESEGDVLRGTLAFEKNTFYLKGEISDDALFAEMYYPCIVKYGIKIGEFSLQRTSEEELLLMAEDAEE